MSYPSNAVGSPYFKAVVVPNTKDEVKVPLEKGADISASLNSILQTVHSNLRPKPYIKPFTNKIIPPEVQKPEQIVLTTINAKGKISGKKNKIQPFQQLSKQFNNNNISNNISSNISSNNAFRLTSNSVVTGDSSHNDLAHIKADWAQKRLIRQRRYIGGPEETNNFATQKRIREVLRQKRILEDMLMAHKKLQRDRVSIQNELLSMRSYLNDIRNQLDHSLSTLYTKKTIFSKYRRPIARPSNTSNASSRTQYSTSTNSTTQRRSNSTLGTRASTKNTTINKKQQRVVPLGQRLQKYVTAKTK